MKRIFSLLLASVIVFGMVAMCAPEAKADSDMSVSDQLVQILKIEEGFVRYPKWDYSQYSIGYGTRCPDDMLEYYRKNGITESEAELLLRNYLNNAEKAVNTKLIDKYGLTLTQGQFDAIVSFSYNMGTGWLSNANQNIHKQIVNGAVGNDLIDAFSRWCKAGNQVYSYLVRRRLSEANMYLNGVYSRTTPDNYCYVRYNGNGGSITQSVQGYDCTLEALPSCIATYSGNTFVGWYTEPYGGTKVEALTKELNKVTLYAHWAEQDAPEQDDSTAVTVKVTTDDVNLRKGPGTNYAIVGRANTGDTFQITQVTENGGYTWGQFSGGWLALQYTNYEQVKAENTPTEPEVTAPETTETESTESETTEPDTTEPETTEPETTVSETTVPETTEPETTEPETTVPETTVPETTVPETTVPETTEPETTVPATEKAETKLIGIVQADPYLCVRKGPGTAYATVDTLRTGEKIEITEQKAVGSMIWGKTAAGWVSMKYVKLEETSEPEMDQNTSQTQKPETGKTGVVNCSLLNIRSGAGITYGIVGNYKKNTTVTILEQKTVGATTWGKTDKGWVSMAYITLKTTTSSGTVTKPETENPTTTPSTGTAVQGTVISDDVLRIRSGAGTSYAIAGFLDPGATVTITETKKVGSTIWGKISKGWISMDYIRLTNTPEEEPEEEITTITKTVNVSCLCIRGGASTDDKIVGYLYRGAKVTVSEIVVIKGTTWGKIAQGWICLAYTK